MAGRGNSGRGTAGSDRAALVPGRAAALPQVASEPNQAAVCPGRAAMRAGLGQCPAQPVASVERVPAAASHPAQDARTGWPVRGWCRKADSLLAAGRRCSQVLPTGLRSSRNQTEPRLGLARRLWHTFSGQMGAVMLIESWSTVPAPARCDKGEWFTGRASCARGQGSLIDDGARRCVNRSQQ